MRWQLPKRVWYGAGMLLTIALVVVAHHGAARAEHARIDLLLLKVDGERLESAIADQEPPLGGVNPRPMVTVKSGEPLVLQFLLDNLYPHGVVKDVKVRYFVVPIDKPRQKTTPSPDEHAVTRGEVVMTFRPKCRVGARLRFRAPEPGLYLVRVDTVKTESDHEHFAAIDLKVE